MKFLLGVCAVFALAVAAQAGCHVARVQKVVAVKQNVVVEKVKVAQILTPVVEVRQVQAFVAPVYGFSAPAYGHQDDSRLQRLEKAVDRLTEKLTAPLTK